jgi:hypothetical protein
MKVNDIIKYKETIYQDLLNTFNNQREIVSKYFIELTAISALLISSVLTLFVVWISARLNPYLQDYAFRILSIYVIVSILIFAGILILSHYRKTTISNY